MRAVNLLPSDLRGSGPKPAPRVRQEPAEGIGAYLLIGVLALCVAAAAHWGPDPSSGPGAVPIHGVTRS